ncbi:MAG: N-acetylmuramoyl-L-alanine amidase [Verrucomicrobiales bacterium]|nr:N-acetylmuramoyl-L-alanine amidase [Verrucomicrobiales bacterium]
MMICSSTRIFIILFAIFGLIAFPASSARAAWKTTKINEITYVPLPDCAAAFSMAAAKPRKDKRELAFAGEFHQLVVKTGTREAIIDGVRHWFSFPVVTASGKAFISLADINATLGPAMRPGSIRQISKVKTIVLDPGHGGHDRGGRSAYGYEKDYTLDVVNRVRKILEKKKVKVVQSRLSDFFVDLSERPAMTSNYKDPIFVSIHFNSAGWKPSANGIEVYALPPLGLPTTGKAPDPILDRRKCDGNAMEPASFVLANTMHHTLLGKTGGFDRGVKRARYAVLRHCDVPSILIECAFLTNPQEGKNIHSTAWREKFSQSVAEGILAYMALANEKQLPPRAWNYKRDSTDEFVWEE